MLGPFYVMGESGCQSYFIRYLQGQHIDRSHWMPRGDERKATCMDNSQATNSLRPSLRVQYRHWIVRSSHLTRGRRMSQLDGALPDMLQDLIIALGVTITGEILFLNGDSCHRLLEVTYAFESSECHFNVDGMGEVIWIYQ